MLLLLLLLLLPLLMLLLLILFGYVFETRLKKKCETYLLYLLAALIKISLIHVFDQITNLR